MTNEQAVRHVPWCDSQLGPEFEVIPGEVRMTITACLGCDESTNPPPTQEHSPEQAPDEREGADDVA